MPVPAQNIQLNKATRKEFVFSIGYLSETILFISGQSRKFIYPYSFSASTKVDCQHHLLILEISTIVSSHSGLVIVTSRIQTVLVARFTICNHPSGTNIVKVLIVLLRILNQFLFGSLFSSPPNGNIWQSVPEPRESFFKSFFVDFVAVQIVINNRFINSTMETK
jgi:hypothetical protein